MTPTDLTLITSLYRTEAYLPAYIERAQQVGAELAAAGVQAEFVLVANDATPTERTLIDGFAAAAQGFRVQPIYVGREPLYASWARAMRDSEGWCAAIWNVDDERSAAGLLDGLGRLREGCTVVDLPYTLARTLPDFGPAPCGERVQRVDYPGMPFDKPGAGPAERLRLGPFFMFTRAIYAAVGPFDGRYKSAGDFAWQAQAGQQTHICTGSVHAGTFYVHGGNLSGAGNPYAAVELNLVRLLHADVASLEPADPTLMQSVCESFGVAAALSPDLRDQLWGAGAAARLAQRQQTLRRAEVRAYRHSLLRCLIDLAGLRGLLHRLGLVRTPPAA